MAKVGCPALNCVRKKLQELHVKEFSNEFKKKAKDKLDDYINNRISSGEYRAWSDEAFAYRVKELHDRAFESCCCTGTPAGSYSWHAILDWESLPPCFMIREGQHILSSCGCTGN